FRVIGAVAEQREALEAEQQRVFAAVDRELTELGVEHDAKGNRAKAYIYCLEARCPETGWMVPLSPSWVISPKQGAVAKLVPNPELKRFDIGLVSGASPKALAEAEKGTVQDGDMVYTLDGKTYRTPIRTLRGDYRVSGGTSGNRLRRWEKSDFVPRPDGIFQERLYAIQWITKKTLDAGRQVTFFAAPTEADLKREQRVEEIAAASLSRWQDEGLVPDM